MSSFNSLMANGLNRITSFLNTDASNQVTYNGTVYNAVVGSRRLMEDLGYGGLQETLAITVVISKTLLPTSPISQQHILINGKDCVIHDVESDEISFELICKTATR